MNLIEIKKEIEARFQIVLTLSIFFPTLLSTFLGSTGMNKDKLDNSVLSWFMLVGLYIMDYILFTLLKKDYIPGWVFKWINYVLIAGIGFFVFPLIILTIAHNSVLFSAQFDLFLYGISLNGLLLAPLLIIVLSVIGFVISIKGGNKKVSKKKKKK